jgi:hypothetical protein
VHSANRFIFRYAYVTRTIHVSQSSDEQRHLCQTFVQKGESNDVDRRSWHCVLPVNWAARGRLSRTFVRQYSLNICITSNRQNRSECRKPSHLPREAGGQWTWRKFSRTQLRFRLLIHEKHCRRTAAKSDSADHLVLGYIGSHYITGRPKFATNTYKSIKLARVTFPDEGHPIYVPCDTSAGLELL